MYWLLGFPPLLAHYADWVLLARPFKIIVANWKIGPI